MKIFTPLVHLVEKNVPGQDTQYFIHVVTFMDNTKYESGGFESLPTLPSSGKFTVTVNVTVDAARPSITLLTPINHTIDLGTMDLDGTPLLEVEVRDSSNALVGSKIVHRDDADEAAMPDPRPKSVASQS